MSHALNIPHLTDPAFAQLSDSELETLRNQHSFDIAEALEDSGAAPSRIIEVLLAIGNHKAIDAFSQLSMETQEACLEAGNTQTMLRFVENMDSDDRVDLLKEVDVEVREAIMPLIAQAERNDIRRLWQYEEGTAGAVMTTEYAMLSRQMTVETALAQLRLQAPNKETIYYIYVTDAQRHLIGILSLRDLIMSKRLASLESIMETQVISVPHEMGVEEVASVISDYDLLAVPVVDGEDRLLGIITVDDVIDIIEAESTEDFQRISGVVPFDEAYFKRTLPRLFLNRFVWLALLLFTTLLSTSMLQLNAGTLHQMMALAFFIPLVNGTCGNAGTQSATMMVRSLALGEILPRDFRRVFNRELVMGLALGLALGLMAYFRVFLQVHNILLGCIVSVALVVTLMTANLIGALMPLVLKQFKLDPALTAGPFIATIMDAVGIFIYFKTAVLMIHHF